MGSRQEDSHEILTSSIEAFVTADPRASERQNVAVGDEVSSQVARLGILAPTARNVTVVLACPPLGEQGAVGADARASPGSSQQVHVSVTQVCT